MSRKKALIARRLKLFVAIVALSLVIVGCGTLKETFAAVRRTPEWGGHKLPDSASVDELGTFPEVIRFAPVLNQHSYGDSLLNFPVSIDFDGDLDARNNRQNLYRDDIKQRLVPTVYYSVIETESHLFITYLVYHASDSWERGFKKVTHYLRLGGSHENDGESIQLVIEKSGKDRQLVLAACQHHAATDFFADTDIRLSSKAQKATKELDRSLVDGDFPNFALEPGKHGIYFSRKLEFSGSRVMTFSPGKNGKTDDVWQADKQDYSYRLLPIREHLWAPYVAGKNVGDKGLMDGAFHITLKRKTSTLEYKNIPRFFNSDEWSVLFMKKDAGIVPFYFGKGHLFFDPAYNYKEMLGAGDDWETQYLYNPYVPVTFGKD